MASHRDLIMSNQRMPPPRPSGHTLIGLEATANGDAPHRDHMRDPDKTPTQSLRDLKIPDGDDSTFYAAIFNEVLDLQRETNDQRRQSNAQRAETNTKLGVASSRLTAVECKVDATISALKVRDEDLFTLLGLPAQLDSVDKRVAKLDEHVGKLLEHMVENQRAIVAIDTRLGHPPHELEKRQSQSGNLTPAELSDLERGTGLAGVVGRSVAEQKRQAARIGIGAAVGAASVPIALELIKFFTT